VLNGKVSKEQALEGKEKIDRVKPDRPGPFLFYYLWQLDGLEGNRLQKRLAGSYFAAFSTNRITIGFKILKICSHPVAFALRFFKSDRLLVIFIYHYLPYFRAALPGYRMSALHDGEMLQIYSLEILLAAFPRR
jgi:hypothetical protein